MTSTFWYDSRGDFDLRTKSSALTTAIVAPKKIVKATRGRTRSPKAFAKKNKFCGHFARSAFRVRRVLASLSLCSVMLWNLQQQPLSVLHSRGRPLRLARFRSPSATAFLARHWFLQDAQQAAPRV